jgi:hypothetical protein
MRFERKLSARSGGTSAAAADQAKEREDVMHGIQRWQQGYRLTELMHEWGHLHRCSAAEICSFVISNREIECETVIFAHDELISLQFRCLKLQCSCGDAGKNPAQPRANRVSLTTGPAITRWRFDNENV